MLHSIPGSRGEGSGPPWSPSDKRSHNNSNPPNRSGHMLMVKTNNTVHPGYAFYMMGTKTAKVEGLWPGKDPGTCA